MPQRDAAIPIGITPTWHRTCIYQSVLYGLTTPEGVTPFGKRFAQTVGLAGSGGVRKALGALERDGVVVRREGSFRIADPFYAAWVAALDGSP